MGCCEKTIQKLKNITLGYKAIMNGEKYEFTDSRVRICQQCAKDKAGGYWIGRTLWCKICKCLIPAKARVENEKCPKGKW